MDFISLAAITFLLYTSNCIQGVTWIEGGRTGYYYFSKISNSTYFYVCLQQILIICYLLYLKIKKKSIKIKKDVTIINESKYWRLLLFFCYTVFGYTIFFQIGISSFFSYASKSTLIENVSFLFSIAIWGAILMCVYFAKHDKWKKCLASGVLILITLVLGSRSYFVTTLIGIFFVKRAYIVDSFRSNIKLSFLGLLLVFLLIQYKNIYMAVRALDFSTVAMILASSDINDTFSDIAEFRIVFSLYDYIVRNDYSLSIGDSLARVFSIVPFLNDLFQTTESARMASIVKNSIFNASYGLGSNFWGESFAMGGGVFLMVMTIIWLRLLDLANKSLMKNSIYTPFVLVIATYCAFYIHRLDWVQVCGCIKSIFLLFIFWKIFSKKSKALWTK